MKQILHHVIVLILLLFVASSCTVEKRVHLPGYHVEWKNSPNKSESIDDQQKNPLPELRAEKAIAKTKATVPVDVSEHDVFAGLGNQMPVDKNTIAPTSSTSTQVVTDVTETVLPVSSERFSKDAEPLAVQNSGERLEVVGLLSMIFGIVGFLSFPFTWPLFGLAALVMSIISFSKFRNRPGEFKGKGFAIAGLVISLVSLLMFLGFWLIVGIA